MRRSALVASALLLALTACESPPPPSTTTTTSSTSTTATAPSTTTTAPAVPAAPTGLTASGRTGKVVLDWADGPTDLRGYEVSRASSASGTSTLLTPTSVTESMYHDTAAPGARSYYRVVAVGTNGSRSSPASASGLPVGSGFGWTSRASSSIGHYEGAGVVVGGKVLVFGGYYNQAVQASPRAQAFDPSSGQWSDLPDLPTLLTHQGAVVDGSQVWLVGGYEGDHPGGPTDEVWVYDTVAATYRPGPSLPEPRAAGTATLVGRQLHYIGGATRTDGVVDDTDQDEHWVLDLGAVDLADPASARWEARAPLPTPRNHVGSAALGGRIYVVGGQHDNSEASQQEAALEVYDPGSDTWASTTRLPVARGHLMWSVVAYQDHLIVAGGMTNGPTTSAAVEAYDPVSRTWVRLASMPAVRKSVVLGLVGNQFVLTQGATSVAQRETWTGRLTVTW